MVNRYVAPSAFEGESPPIPLWLVQSSIFPSWRVKGEGTFENPKLQKQLLQGWESGGPGSKHLKMFPVISLGWHWKCFSVSLI